MRGEAADGDGAVRLARERRPDIVLMGVRICQARMVSRQLAGITTDPELTGAKVLVLTTMTKIDACGRAQLVVLAYESGLVTPGGR